MPSSRETAALARQGWLLASRPLRGHVPRRHGGDLVAVFVHGFLAGGAVLDPMRHAVVTQAGVDTAVFQYSPLRSFEHTARALAAKTHRVRGNRRLVLVGHSLGGLLARYAAEVEGASADLIVTMATPHRGTNKAEGFPGELARSLRPGSRILRQLGSASPLPHVAIVAGDDTIIPAYSAAPDDATIHNLTNVGHNELLFDPRAHALLVETLKRIK